MSSYGGYGYGQAKPRVPRPVATSPLSQYGGLSPYQAQPVRRLSSAQTTGAPQPATAGQIPQAGRAAYDPGDSTPVKALSTSGVNATPGTTLGAAAAPTAPNVYDINTDPALQAITALTGRSDADAKAAALKQETGQVLGYGDPSLAAALLGAGDPNVQAAGQNPTSTLHQLGDSYGRNVHDLTENLNKQNLFYGGYRVTQEQQAAQDYQNALAAAAASVHGNLDTIQGNLAQALAANQAQRIAAMQSASLTMPGFPSGTIPGAAGIPSDAATAAAPLTGPARTVPPPGAAASAIGAGGYQAGLGAAPAAIDPNLAAVLAAAGRQVGTGAAPGVPRFA